LKIAPAISVGLIAFDPQGVFYACDKTRAKLFRLDPTSTADSYTAVDLAFDPAPALATIASLTFDGIATAYAYTASGIQVLSVPTVQGTKGTVASVVTASSAGKTIPGPLPASVAKPQPTRSNLDIAVSGGLMKDGRFIFTDNQSIYAVNP
jgi:hypothetical protein